MRIDIKLDKALSDQIAALGGEIERKVVRSTAYAGAQVIYAEVLRNVPVLDGLLKSAIYHAYADALSVDGRQVYRVSWNYRKAPHGHLVEFGHWRINKAYYKDGKLYFTKERLKQPVWVAPKSFIRKSADALPRANQAMLERAAVRLKEALQEMRNGQNN